MMCKLKSSAIILLFYSPWAWSQGATFVLVSSKKGYGSNRAYPRSSRVKKHCWLYGDIDGWLDVMYTSHTYIYSHTYMCFVFCGFY